MNLKILLKILKNIVENANYRYFQANIFFSQSSTVNTNHDTVLDEPELVLHRDEFPYLGAGDIVEIYQPDVDSGSEDPFPSLLLKVCI